MKVHLQNTWRWLEHSILLKDTPAGQKPHYVMCDAVWDKLIECHMDLTMT